MAGLVKSTQSIPLQLGIDTEHNPVVVDGHRFVELENAVFDKTQLGQLHKRPGYVPLLTSVLGGGTIGNEATNLGRLNNELEAVANGNLYSLSPGAQKWISRGTLPQVMPTETPVASGASSITNPDVSVSTSGVAVHAYEQTGACWIRALDSASGTVLFAQQLMGAGAAIYTPKVLANGALGWTILGTDAQGNIWAFQVTPNLGAASSTLLVASGLAVSATTSESIFDATILGTSLVICGRTQGATPTAQALNIGCWVFAAVGLAARSSNTALVAGSATTPVNVTPFGTQFALTSQPGGSGAMFTDIVTVGHSPGYALVITNSFSYGSIAAPPTRIGAVAVTQAATTYLSVLYEVPAGGVAGGANTLPVIYAVTISLGGVGAISEFAISVNLVSQPWGEGSTLYVLCVFPSLLQQTLFLMGWTPYGLTGVTAPAAQVAGKFFNLNNAGAAPSNGRLPQVNASGNSITTAVLNQTTGVGTAGANTTVNALVQLELSFTEEVRSSQLGQDLHLATGSLLWDYDGFALTEHGFNIFPEKPTISYATSQLTVITDSYDPTCGTNGESQGSFRIAIPDNGASPGGPVGQLITPGEYLQFFADGIAIGSGTVVQSPIIVYFIVNGVGSPPAGTDYSTFTMVPCAITTGMTAQQVAQALWTTFVYSSNVHLGYTLTAPTALSMGGGLTAWTIGLTSIAVPGVQPAAVSPPTLNRAASAVQVYNAANTSTGARALVSCIPASLISSGQYVTISVPCVLGTSQLAKIYFWFSNASKSAPVVDPNPFGIPAANAATTIAGWSTRSYAPFAAQTNYIGIQIPLTGIESESQIAGYLFTAFNALAAVYGLSAAALPLGASVRFVASSAFVSIASADYASNPLNTGMGQGYVGDVVDGVSSMVAINYASVYEWVDNANELHQSAPSGIATAWIPTYVALGGGMVPAGSNVPVSAVVNVLTNPLSLTLKSSRVAGPSGSYLIQDADIAIYRTLSGATSSGLIYYRASSPTALVLNSTVAASPIVFSDFSSDYGYGSVLGLNSGQTLYTTGGLAEYDAPPACSLIVNHQNRLWLAGLENPNLLWYSEEFSQGYGVGFSDLQTILMNPIVGTVSGGPIVQLASMDGNLIVLQENQVWYIQGTGPDDTGNGQFAMPQLVASSSAIGCRDPGSVVLTPDGLIFKGSGGFYMLTRSLQLQFIGADVKAFNADVVTSAQCLSWNNGVIFLSGTGTTLYYDYYYKAWSTFTNHQGLDSIRDASGAYNYVNASGQICLQTPGSYIDANGSGYPLLLQTAWLKPGGIQGFGRIWKALLQGLFVGTQPYQVQIGYNYASTPTDAFLYHGNAGSAAPSYWGSSPLWGEYIWGLDGGVVVYPDSQQFRVYPSNQLCESIQFTIQDLAPFSPTETPAFNAMDWEVGIRKGAFKRGPGGAPGASIG